MKPVKGKAANGADAPAIPLNWSVPAEVSAKEAEATVPRVRASRSEGGSSPLLLGIGAAVVAAGAVALATGVIPLGPKSEVAGPVTVAETAPPVELPPIDATDDTQPPDEATPPAETAPSDVAPVDAAPTDVAPVDAPPKDAAPSDAVPVDATPSDAAPVDAPPTEAEPVEEPLPGLPAVELEELPVRKRVKGIVAEGEAQIRQGDFKGAVKTLQQAAKVDPSFAPTFRALGVARAQLGDATGARIAYQRYLKLAPTASDAPDIRRILSE